MNLPSINTRSLIAITLIIATVALIFTMMFVPVPNSDVFKVAIGSLFTVGFATIIGFYFGSSDGSKAKDDTMNQIALSSVPEKPKVPPAAAIAFLALAATLALGQIGAARAADAPTPAPSSVPASSSFGQPCVVTGPCTGFTLGFNLLGVVTSADPIANGILGSTAPGSQDLGIEIGYQYWDNKIYAAGRFIADYGVGGSAIAGGYSAPKWRLAEIGSVGMPLASLFGSSSVPTPPTTGIASQITQSTISPYFNIGLMQTPWSASGFVTGAGIAFAPGGPWIATIDYLHVTYPSNQASPIQSNSSENILMASLKYKF